MNRAAERCAYRLIEACEAAVHAAGGRIIYDGSQLPSDLYGCMVANRAGHRTIFVTDEYDDIMFESVILAHETAHFFDPWLIRVQDRPKSRRETHQSEMVAHGASMVLATFYGLDDHYDMGWFEDCIQSHLVHDKYFNESRAYFRRIDAAANSVLPSEGRQWLWKWRTGPGHLPAEVPLSNRVSSRFEKWLHG